MKFMYYSDYKTHTQKQKKTFTIRTMNKEHEERNT